MRSSLCPVRGASRRCLRDALCRRTKLAVDIVGESCGRVFSFVIYSVVQSRKVRAYGVLVRSSCGSIVRRCPSRFVAVVSGRGRVNASLHAACRLGELRRVGGVGSLNSALACAGRGGANVATDVAVAAWPGQARALLWSHREYFLRKRIRATEATETWRTWGVGHACSRGSSPCSSRRRALSR